MRAPWHEWRLRRGAAVSQNPHDSRAVQAGTGNAATPAAIPMTRESPEAALANQKGQWMWCARSAHALEARLGQQFFLLHAGKGDIVDRQHADIGVVHLAV